jgi:uncharacterized protein (UPF0218 family)
VVGVNRRITPKLRAELKKPLGELLEGNGKLVQRLLQKKLDGWKPQRIIAVGDKVSETLLTIGPKSCVYIYDGKTKRMKTASSKLKNMRTINVRNPAGTLTEEAIEVVKKALKKRGSTYIWVTGEEDLLTLAAVAYAPQNALVIYGQPDQGVVAVKVNQYKKSQAKKLIDEMELCK